MSSMLDNPPNRIRCLIKKSGNEDTLKVKSHEDEIMTTYWKRSYTVWLFLSAV